MGLQSKLSTQFRAEFLARIISILSGGVLTVALARLLDPDLYGLFYLSISILGMAILFSKLGIARSGSRYIANYKETNPDQIPHILKFTIKLNTITILIASLLLLLSYETISLIVGEPELVPLLLLGTLYLAFKTLFYLCRLLFQGFEDIKRSALINAIQGSARTVIAVVFVIVGFGAIGALLGYILAYALAAIIGFLILYKNYNFSETSKREPNLRRRIAEYSLPITLTNTASVIDRKFDTVLVGFFLDPLSVAFYTVGKQITEFVEAPISALGFTLAPTYEAQKANNNNREAARLYEKAISHGLLVYIPAAVGLILVADPLIELIFGPEYIGAVEVVQVFAIYVVVVSISDITSNGLDFLGRARERSIARGISAIGNVALNILLIPSLGVIGAVIATVITYSFYTFVNVYIMSDELNIYWGNILWKVVKIVMISAIMGVVVYSIVGYVTGIITLLAVISFGVLVWMSLSIYVGLIDTNTIYNLM
jgi:O-antigen/teichoic acid export membrane protein